MPDISLSVVIATRNNSRSLLRLLKTLGAQIEPILIVMLGILVLILALGVFLPMWDLGKVAFGRK